MIAFQVRIRIQTENTRDRHMHLKDTYKSLHLRIRMIKTHTYLKSLKCRLKTEKLKGLIMHDVEMMKEVR